MALYSTIIECFNSSLEYERLIPSGHSVKLEQTELDIEDNNSNMKVRTGYSEQQVH